HWTITDRIHIGGAGGWDYVTVQPEAHRIFLSHAAQVVVVDLKSKKIIDSIAASGVHGIALARDLNRGFISNGAGGNVTIFDLGTLKVLGTVKTGQNPDAICYEPVTQKVFAFNGRSSSATVIDAVKGEALGDIPLEGKPEFAQPDGQGFVYVNLEDKSKTLRIDAKKMTVTDRWDLPGGSEPSAMAIDTANKRLFIGCGNKQLVVKDYPSGKTVATEPIGEDVDAAIYDPVGKRVFVSCSDGTMTVIHQDSADTYTVQEVVPTEQRDHTMGFDPTTATAYVPTAKFGPAPAPTPDHPKPRPSIVPDSFELLVITSNQ
ncbi:MAG TPA: hypothetical protein VL981_05965, partial [Candidatus Methylacidiphilales bacterium]|nr:hypothetical protein [Candidatus Methylacidiphilales bacterium]